MKVQKEVQSLAVRKLDPSKKYIISIGISGKSDVGKAIEDVTKVFAEFGITQIRVIPNTFSIYEI